MCIVYCYIHSGKNYTTFIFGVLKLEQRIYFPLPSWEKENSLILGQLFYLTIHCPIYYSFKFATTDNFFGFRQKRDLSLFFILLILEFFKNWFESKLISKIAESFKSKKLFQNNFWLAFPLLYKLLILLFQFYYFWLENYFPSSV